MDNVQMSILITGINGQDGRIISRHFKSVGEHVFGISRHNVSYPDSEIMKEERIDISDYEAFSNFLDCVNPTRIFHLAASHSNSIQMQNHGEHFESEMYSLHVQATKNILEWQKCNPRNGSKLVVALSSQMFTADECRTTINEDSPINPSSKYGMTKSQAFELITQYRQNYGIFSTGAILFNHSSPFSKQDFVLVEIAKQFIDVLSGDKNEIKLRNFDAELDVSDAENICSALIGMLDLAKPEDFVLSSGNLTNLRNLTIDCLARYNVVRKIDLISTHPPQGSRNNLIGNSQKASTKLNWKPTQDPVLLLVKIIEALRGNTANV